MFRCTRCERSSCSHHPINSHPLVGDSNPEREDTTPHMNPMLLAVYGVAAVARTVAAPPGQKSVLLWVASPFGF